MEERKVYPVVAADYKLLEEVGQGVSAVVYRAVCLPFNEVVAIKSLDLEKCSSNLDEIRREAQMMCLINHPNVVRAYCSFVVEHSLWVVMPYMAGGSCLHIMKSAFPDGFEEAVIATVLKEVLKALDYLHRHGHIHRDVKAGNILIDANGAVKLGDFGVSACLFDTGDRQRARITFVGTPCWMAPEVMEQLHGYDFKADIWSFGITALELAHGHAPFSKYPPMKVLLMTLQNAPPGLDYERDKRFSKSFKEMIAMCLVKDPQKRPTADKLLKHSFFKGAKSGEYLARNVLIGLPPLWERVKNLKLTDAARLAQKKMPFGEQEEMSQKEYKRAVSSWNFDLEDLKAQAALIGNEDDICIDKEEEPKQPEATEIHREIASKAPSAFSSDVSEVHSGAVDQLQAPQASLGKHDDVLANGRTPFTRSVGSPSSSHSKPATAVKHAHGMLPPTRKEPKHIGRFDVFEDDNDVSPSFHESSKPKFEESIQRSENGLRKTEEKEAHGEREKRHPEEREIDDHRRASSGPLIAERVLSSYRSRDDEKERPCGPCPQRASFSGPLTSSGPTLESRPANGAPSSLRPPAGNKDGGDDKMKGTLVRGRFRVTPDHTMASEDAFLASGPRRTSSVQSLAQLPSTVPQQSYQPPSSNGLPAVPVASLFPQLQSLLHQTEVQQDIIINLMCNMNQGEGYGGQKLCVQPSRNVPRPEQGEGMSDRERELLQQVSELKSRVVMLVEELASVKTRNVQLERQLNAIYNKEEEEKIRREEAAKDV